MRGVLCRPSRNIACRACVLCVPLLIEFRLYERLHSLIDRRRGAGVVGAGVRGAVRSGGAAVALASLALPCASQRSYKAGAAAPRAATSGGGGAEKRYHIPVMLGPLSIGERLPPPTHMPVPNVPNASGSLMK